MISNDLRNLIGSMRAHVDADQMSKGFFAVFETRLREVADDIEQLEQANVLPHLRGTPSPSGCTQLSLVSGGRS